MSTTSAFPRLRRPQGSVLIVDVPGSVHADSMKACARVGLLRAEIVWLPPTIDLPRQLAALSAVDAVAIPVGVRGGGPDDRFTQRMLDSVAALARRRIPVFVAVGSHRKPNFLASSPDVVSAGPLFGGRHPARLRLPVPRRFGSSGAAARAAALSNLLRRRIREFRRGTARPPVAPSASTPSPG